MAKKKRNRKIFLGVGLLGSLLAVALIWQTLAIPKETNILGAQSSSKISQFFTNIKRVFTWKTFKTDEYGYSIRYPKGWVVKEQSTEHSRGVTVTEPGGLALVTIASYKDDRLKEEGMLEAALEAKEEELKGNSNYQISGFEKKVEGNVGGYVATGKTNFEDYPMTFIEKGLYDAYGKMLFMHGAVVPEYLEEYQGDVEGIMESFKIW